VKRRTFIATLGSAAAWPVVARGQQAMPVIGFLSGASLDDIKPTVAAFRQALKEAGYIEGKNVVIEYRWAQNKIERLPELAADLVRQQVTVVVAPGSTPAALAAKNATAAIPIVFGIGGDPVRIGLVASLNRPGGNVTGISNFTTAMAGKRIELLHNSLPQAARFAMLVNPKNQIVEQMIEDGQAAAAAIGRPLEVLRANTEGDIDAVFESLTKDRVDALLISPDPLFFAPRAKIIALAARGVVPTMYPFRDDVLAGGLMSYGADEADTFRQIGIYTARVLKGEKPSDLPVVRGTKFQFVINLQTARALGIEIPPSVLARADEVIE
jgi:putative ABC transport system substrate-binding protein